ncbi:MAG: hypothetical protein EP346_09950 [Bacteroidetes bacterium]|nr:MAG: hypothetical protein EP346_09950 [Bacteroidota bacterium]
MITNALFYLRSTIVIGCFSLISCSQNKGPSSILQDFYTPAEIEDIHIILNYSDQMFMRYAGINDPAEAYRNFVTAYSKAQDGKPLFDSLYVDPTSTIHSIAKGSFYQDTYYVSTFINTQGGVLAPKPDSRYISFLMKLAEEDSFYAEYAEIIHSASDFTPSLIWGLPNEMCDFDNPDVRTVWAIQFLAIFSRGEELP